MASPLRRRTAAAALCLLAACAEAQAREVGVAAAVNPQAVGVPRGEAERVIRVGLDVLRNERIETGPEGRAQMLFLDGSALTIGPSSEVTLDEFVFDPDSGSGKLALSASKGLFRFVGGKISKTSAVSIRTPSATIGVRGGIAVVEVGAQSTRAQFLFGQQMTVSAGGEVREVSRPGFEITASPGAPPSPPAPLSETSVARNMGGFEGVQGSTGGAQQRPTDENVAGTQINRLSSGNAPERVAPAQQGGRARPPAPRPPGREQAQATRGLLVDNALASAGQDRAQAETGLGSSFSYGGHVYAGTPFLSFDLETLVAVRNTEDNVAYSGGAIRNGFFTATIGGEFVRLPAQVGEFSFSGALARYGDDPVFGKGFVSPDLAFFAYSAESVVDGGRGFLFGGVPYDPPADPTGFAAYKLKPAFPGGDHIPFLPFDTGGNFGGASVSPLLVRYREAGQPAAPGYRPVALYGAIALEGQGPGQRSAMVTYTGAFFVDPALGKDVLSGFANGSVRMNAGALPVRVGQGGSSSPDAEGNSFFGLSSLDYFVLDSDFYPPGMPTPRQSAVGFRQGFENPAAGDAFFQTQLAARRDLPAGLGTSRTSRLMNGYAGAVADVRTGFVSGVPQFAPDVYVNQMGDPFAVTIGTDAGSNRAAATLRLGGSFASVDLEFGGFGPAGARSSFIDDRLFGLRDSVDSPSRLDGSPSSFSGGLLTSGFFDDRSAAPPGVTLCACEHLTWGFFSGDLRNAGPERLRFHLAPFVAGELPNPANIPLSGTAIYAGHVAANVANGGARYVAFGNFTQTWSFGQRAGSISITDLDGASYSGGVSSGNGRDFVGSLSGAGRSGSVSGSLFRGGGDPAAASGGSISANGSGYQLGGVFVARRQ